MRPTVIVTGSIPTIVRNALNVYDGNLVHYYQALFREATNLENPYHNFGHIGNVLFLCHDACVYYAGTPQELSGREARNLLIAAIFHDFDHTGRAGDDWVNIRLAIEALRRHVRPCDLDQFEEIEKLIIATKYPYEAPSVELSLSEQILRDADKCQALSVTWFQQVVIGLAMEWNKPRMEVLEMQVGFHSDLVLTTEWAQEKYPIGAIQAKIDEAREHVSLLTMTEW